MIESAPFEQLLKGAFSQMHGADAFSPLREKAWERYQAMGLPSRKDPAFGYIPLRDFYSAMAVSPPDKKSSAPLLEKEAIKKAILPQCARSHVVLVDGSFCPHLSDLSALDGLICLSLAEAMRSHGHFLKAHLAKAIKEETDPFALLNLAMHPSGLFLYAPPKTAGKAPLQCLHVITEQAQGFTAGRVQLVMGADSTLQWISTHFFLHEETGLCCAPLLDLFLDQRTRCTLSSHLSPLASQWYFDSVRGYLKADASLQMVSIIGGSRTTRLHVRVQCAGENSEADLKGLWMLRGSQQAHVHATVDHSAPHTRSMQLFKGVLFDASQSSFEGKIIVQQIAQKTQAYQLNKHLLLGKAALAQSKPNLEIHADDVKASHGSTIARPNPSELFYLKSRGIAEEKAQQLLVEGFCREILDHIPISLGAAVL